MGVGGWVVCLCGWCVWGEVVGWVGGRFGGVWVCVCVSVDFELCLCLIVLCGKHGQAEREWLERHICQMITQVSQR